MFVKYVITISLTSARKELPGMLAFMNKTLSRVNEDLKEGKTVIVTAAAPDAAPQTDSGEPDPEVHAVTTATFENSLHRLPHPLPPKPEKAD